MLMAMVNGFTARWGWNGAAATNGMRTAATVTVLGGSDLVR